MLVNFGQNLQLSSFFQKAPIVQVSDNSIISQQNSAQAIFGGNEISGGLPYHISNDLPFHTGQNIPKNRLAYNKPQFALLDTIMSYRIDSLVYNAINAGAFPGCQVFVARKGVVVFNKAYGNISYGGNAVTTNTLYDLASVTKIAATTVACMRMITQGKISLSTKLGDCFNNTFIEYTKIKPDTVVNIDTLLLRKVRDINKILKLQDTLHLNDSEIIAYDTLITKTSPAFNIFQVELEALLRHQSGVLPSLPILPLYLYRMNYDKNNFKIDKDKLDFILDSLKKHNYAIPRVDTTVLSNKTIFNGFYRYYLNFYNDTACGIEIAKNFYLRKEYWDTLWIDVKQMSVFSRRIAQYTDVNMLLLQQAIDSVNDKSIDEYLKEEIYQPLNLNYITYEPLRFFNLSQIAPTEFDRIWRMQQLHGYVHDPTAAFFGGYAGNAGLFASAHNLGILFQMVLNGGTYGGRRFIDENVVQKFTSRQPESDRALGFDMKFAQTIIAQSVSDETYGHLGYTGTCVWVDPKEEIVYVFLSNRVYPNGDNWKLNGYKVRQGIQQIIYDAIIE